MNVDIYVYMCTYVEAIDVQVYMLYIYIFFFFMKNTRRYLFANIKHTCIYIYKYTHVLYIYIYIQNGLPDTRAEKGTRERSLL